MGRILFAVFLIVPLIEIGLFIWLGQLIGLLPTLLGVVVTAMIGSFVVRSQGVSLIAEIRRLTAAGVLPGRQIADGVMLAVAGALLLTPGYFTDTAGFLLLVPPVRGWIYAQIASRLVVTTAPRPGPTTPKDGGTIDLDERSWR